VIVAVVDSGADAAHPLLAPRLTTGLNLHEAAGWEDTSGHGSHVAGIIAQDAPAAQIMPLKVTDSLDGLDLGAAAQAIRFAADHGAKVINVSWVYMGSQPEIHDAIVYAGTRGSLVVAAAGNWSWNLDISGAAWPADESALPNVITVAATCDGSTLAPFSNYGHDRVNVAALGCEISSAWMDGSSHLLSGTSMAAPRVAAAAAALFAKRPADTPLAIKDALIASCTPSADLADKVGCGGSL
jgi:subtilisin family serine protease